jgi:hypothetical protein
MVKALALVAVAACSVPDAALEGKACPCASGYACGADMKCHSSQPMPDGKQVDTPATASCLGTAPGAMIASGFSGFQTDGGTWATGAQLQQTNAASGLAFAFTTNSAANTANYRVVATMTGTTPGTSMGIAIRITSGMKTQYDCLWDPGTAGTLLLQQVNNGGQPSTLATAPPVTTNLQVTMELLATGSSFKCCIDGIAGATVTGSDANNSYASGFPGVVVVDMHATFTAFTVYTN